MARIEGDLDDPFAVSQVDENEPAQVAAAMNPAAEANSSPNVVSAQCATEVSAE
jgi:hypothetical protein